MTTVELDDELTQLAKELTNIRKILQTEGESSDELKLAAAAAAERWTVETVSRGTNIPESVIKGWVDEMKNPTKKSPVLADPRLAVLTMKLKAHPLKPGPQGPDPELQKVAVALARVYGAVEVAAASGMNVKTLQRWLANAPKPEKKAKPTTKEKAAAIEKALVEEARAAGAAFATPQPPAAPDVDPEIAAMGAVSEVLGKLAPAPRRRVLAYVMLRFGETT